MSIESRSKQYGSIFGNWHIGHRLDDGANGKSAVFELYRDSNGWRECSALKVIGLIEERGSREELTPHRQNEYSTAAREVRSRAEQEVRLMEQLRGKTNIVDYLDHSFFEWRDENGFGVDLLIRMELLNCLRTEMRADRQFDDAEIIKIGKDICSALEQCHGKNIIHRDIKPENIFFNSDGDYKLGDFGISRMIKESPSPMVSTGVGTPAYAAPEQSSGAYDKRVDIYSLGLVLYELCNGNRLPFARSSYVGEGEIRLRMSGTPLPLPGTPISVDPFMTHDANPSGNPDKTAAADPYATKKARHSEKLIRVIMKACAFRPEDRFATAQEMLDALMDKTPDPSPNPSLSSSPNSNPSLNPNPPKIITGIAICAVLLILAAGVSWWIRKHRPDPNPTPEPTLEATPEPTAEPTPKPTPDPTAAPTPESTPEPTAAPTPELTPEPTAVPTPEPTAQPTIYLPTEGVSNSGTRLKNIQYDQQGRILSLSELSVGSWTDWNYVYDADGYYLYRYKDIGQVYSYLTSNVMPGTDISYYELSEPVENCVGFTLKYEVTTVKSGDGLGDRYLYTYDGRAWTLSATFGYGSYGVKYTDISLEKPTIILYYATPRIHPDSSSFMISQSLEHVRIADYSYIAPEGGALDTSIESNSVAAVKTGPGLKDMAGCNSEVWIPRPESWLSDYETKYVRTSKGRAAYLRYAPDLDYGYFDLVKEGTEITILARQDGASLAKVKDGVVGWIGSSQIGDS